jgi:hypothetical protein
LLTPALPFSRPSVAKSTPNRAKISRRADTP